MRTPPQASPDVARRLTRREAIALFATLALAGRATSQATRPAPDLLRRPPDGWAAEAERLARRVQGTFWDADRRTYVAPVAYDGTVPTRDWHGRFIGHTLWSWCEALGMIAAAATNNAQEWAKPLADLFDGLEKYHDPDRDVYNAWVRFPGNVDSYSDDNAWLIMHFCEATRATGDRRYADRGDEVMEGYLSTEWRKDDGPLGMRWGFNPAGGPRHNQRAAISASTAAVAALGLADLGYRPDVNRRRAADYLGWVQATCVDDDGLVMDGLQPGLGDDGGWGLQRKRWSYNTGLFVIGNAMLHAQTGDAGALARLRRSADAAINFDGLLYNSTITDPSRRHLSGPSFFASHLIEGFVVASKATGDPRYREAAEREAAYLYTFVRDADDGLYFRTLSFWRIDRTRFDAFRSDFAGAVEADGLSFRPDGGERGPGDGPAADRPLVKTLLASAAVARAYAVLGATP